MNAGFILFEGCFIQKWFQVAFPLSLRVVNEVYYHIVSHRTPKQDVCFPPRFVCEEK